MTTLLTLLVLGKAPNTLAVDGLLVANYRKGKWSVCPSTKPTWKSVAFTQIGIGKLGATVNVPGAIIMELSGMPYLDLRQRPLNETLWNGPKPAFPRRLSVTTKPDKAIQELILEIARVNGKVKPVAKSWLAVKGDFDGNGKSETLVFASSVSELTIHDESAWNTVQLVVGPHKAYQLSWNASQGKDEGVVNTFISAVADFNRDGIYEIVLSNWYHEGNGGQVFTIKAGKPVRVVENGS
jgi:hypothetical protein